MFDKDHYPPYALLADLESKKGAFNDAAEIATSANNAFIGAQALVTAKQAEVDKATARTTACWMKSSMASAPSAPMLVSSPDCLPMSTAPSPRPAPS